MYELKRNWCFVASFILWLYCCGCANTITIEEKMRMDDDLSQFYSMLESNNLANVTIQLKSVTVFAPTNEAFQKTEYKGNDAEDLVLYHMTNLPKTADQLGASYTCLYSEVGGSPPLWITRSRGIYHDDVYVNNARLLLSQSNFKSKNKDNQEQVLHKIDEVLIPTRSPKTISNRQYNPTALEFLEHFEALNINPHRVRSFRQRVQLTKKQDIFRTDGGHTFFIPVDEGFQTSRAESIDGKTIDGHVIPKRVLFTAPTKKDIPYETLANGDNNLRVVITFSQENEGNTKHIYVKSHTVLGDNKHTPGVVMVEIVKANIPVKNGVIHLIHKPLMVVDNTVKELLEDKEDGPLSRFYQEIKDAGKIGEDFLKTMEQAQDLTLFAPSNAAWDDGNLRNLLRDKENFRDILHMHLVVDHRLYLEKIVKNNDNPAYREKTMNKRKDLFFNVATFENNRTLTVEGGGVNATVIQADLAATNGIIHIIDRVLGVPYTTVLDKLRTDPMLNDTYILGKRRGFNNQLNDTTRKFTYFVPRNEAWKEARVSLPSAIKKLFMEEFGYHANAILERHLVISSVPYTMERIKQLTNDSMSSYGTTYTQFGNIREVELPTVRDTLRLNVEERSDQSFIIHWKGEKIPVFRPNVECTNGIIHVIDAPFLQEGDIRVSSAPKTTNLAYGLLMVSVMKWFLL